MIFGFKIGLTRLGLIFASALAIFGSRLTERAPSQRCKSLEGYDAAEPLKSTCRIWKTEQGSEGLFYSLGRLQGSNKSASPAIAAYLGLPKGKGPNPVSFISTEAGNGQIVDELEDWMRLGYVCESIGRQSS